MAGKRPQYNFRPDAAQLDALKTFQEEHDANKTEAAKHYVSKGIQAEIAEENGGRANGMGVLELIVAQMAVAAIAVLMMGPGIAIIPPGAAWYVALGFIFLAFWTYISIHFGWVEQLATRVREHLRWVNDQAGVR